jgi:hypothetical protein
LVTGLLGVLGAPGSPAGAGGGPPPPILAARSTVAWAIWEKSRDEFRIRYP